MMDAINGVIDFFDDRSESERDSSSKSNSKSNNQSDSSSEHSENEEESKSIETRNESKYTIGPSISIKNSDVDIKLERQLPHSSLILKEKIKPCYSYKKNEKERQSPQSPKEESKEEIDESSENYVDQCIRRLQRESLKKNLDENQSKENKEFEQALLERVFYNFSISTSQNVCHTDDKNSNGIDKFIEKLYRMTLENQVSEIKDIDHDNIEENKSKVVKNKKKKMNEKEDEEEIKQMSRITSIESDWIKSDNLSAFDESEIAKQIGFRLTNCGLKYEIERNK